MNSLLVLTSTAFQKCGCRQLENSGYIWRIEGLCVHEFDERWIGFWGTNSSPWVHNLGSTWRIGNLHYLIISGITKSFTTGTDVPALKLTFRVAGIALDNQIQGIYDEVLGKFKLGLRGENISVKSMQLNNYPTAEVTCLIASDEQAVSSRSLKLSMSTSRQFDLPLMAILKCRDGWMTLEIHFGVAMNGHAMFLTSRRPSKINSGPSNSPPMATLTCQDGLVTLDYHFAVTLNVQATSLLFWKPSQISNGPFSSPQIGTLTCQCSWITLESHFTVALIIQGISLISQKPSW